MKKIALLLLLPVAAFGQMDVEVDIEWVPPTENVDGTPLTDLNKYTVFWGFSSGQYSQSLDVMDASATSYTLLVNGVENNSTIYVVMTASDFDQNASAYSNEAAYGPFVESDALAPAAPTLNNAGARVVNCPPGRSCAVQN